MSDRTDHAAEIRDAIRQYGRECENAVESFRCAEPDLDAVMALIEPHLRIAEAAREWAARRREPTETIAEGLRKRARVAIAEHALLAAVDAEQAGGES